MSRRPDYSNKEYILDLLPSLGLLSIKEPLRRLLNTAEVAAPKRAAEKDPVVEPDPPAAASAEVEFVQLPDYSDENERLSGKFTEIAYMKRLFNTDGSVNMPDAIMLLVSMNAWWMKFYRAVPETDRALNHICEFTPEYTKDYLPGPRPKNMPICVENPHWLQPPPAFCGKKHDDLQAAKTYWLGVLQKGITNYWAYDRHHGAKKNRERALLGITKKMTDDNFKRFKDLIQEEVTDVKEKLEEIKSMMNNKTIEGIGKFIGRGLPSPPGWIVYNKWMKPTKKAKDDMLAKGGEWQPSYGKLDPVYCGPMLSTWDQKIEGTNLYQVFRARSPNEAWYIYLGYNVMDYDGTVRKTEYAKTEYKTEEEWKEHADAKAVAGRKEMDEILRQSRETREKVSDLLGAGELDSDAAAEDAPRDQAGAAQELTGLEDLSSDDERK